MSEAYFEISMGLNENKGYAHIELPHIFCHSQAVTKTRISHGVLVMTIPSFE